MGQCGLGPEPTARAEPVDAAERASDPLLTASCSCARAKKGDMGRSVMGDMGRSTRGYLDEWCLGVEYAKMAGVGEVETEEEGSS